MAVLGLSGWTSRLNQIPKIASATAADINFADAIGDLTDPLEVIGGTPGIILFARPIFATALDAMTPSAGMAWASIMANAWQSALAASVITPGTVSDPAWVGSGNSDVDTLPIGASTIINLAAAMASLQSALLTSQPAIGCDDFAKAFRDATLMLQFQVIGKGPPPPLPQIPLVKGVQ